MEFQPGISERVVASLFGDFGQDIYDSRKAVAKWVALAGPLNEAMTHDEIFALAARIDTAPQCWEY